MGIFDNILGNVKSDIEGRTTEKITSGISKRIFGGGGDAKGKCPKCKKPLAEENLKFCPACGAKLMAKCKKCGMDFPLETKFCTECGGPLR
jgi:predicted amidophosphoribosyltransferase